jgi:hypothetical protein
MLARRELRQKPSCQKTLSMGYNYELWSMVSVFKASLLRSGEFDGLVLQTNL